MEQAALLRAPAVMPAAKSVVPDSRIFCASSTAASTATFSFWRRDSFWRRGTCFSTDCRSARISSVLIVSMSSLGETLPSTWTTFSSLKARMTWQIASDSRMFARNLLPRPSPSEAPRTMPAMSTKSTVAGRIFWELKTSASLPRRGSGTPTTPTFGSIVANG